MTDTRREATLKRVLCFQYPVRFHQKNDDNKEKDIRALIDSGSKVNAMHPTYATKLGLYTRKIDIGVQKIDGSHLNTFGMVIAD